MKPVKNKEGTLLFIILEMVGFLMTILIIMLDELIDLPYLLFHAPKTLVRYPEALLETLFILIVCAGVISATIWSLNRIKRLESYIVMCAWCRKIKMDDDRWVTIEEYMWEKDERQISHGLCETCAEEQIEIIRKGRSASG
jgi:hypothetical protein